MKTGSNYLTSFMGIASDGGLFSIILKYDIRIVFDRAIRRHTMDIELWAIAYKFCRKIFVVEGDEFCAIVYRGFNYISRHWRNSQENEKSLLSSLNFFDIFYYS